ncbi:MAG: hypothetical protein COY82_00660 [Parcubacteria group bacterium CG_4_10_14_0_8_um_filter_35_7]|nr:MAG: hypothetical protein COX43_02245 [Parcubacteria group bacterium CG23_combo_of_CG06-09_8_20_14_all_35_9]PIY78782.1 MAG: hypothetical protein COY82_00660 [Parcubacteria group bacterium CG_4_10_14_0_8_um_filter_35_7]
MAAGINLKEFFTLKYLFSFHPPSFHPIALKVLLGVFLFILFVGIISQILVLKTRRKDPIFVKLWQRICCLSWTMGFIGLVLLFFCYEGVPFFNGRFWFLFWLIGVLVWKGIIIKFLIFEVPKNRKELAKRRRFEKYLPKRT